HATSGSFSLGRGSGDMIGIGGIAIAGDLTVNPRPALLGMFEFFQHEHARPFAHDETIAFDVKRARSPFWLLVASAERLHRAKAGNPDGDDGRLGPASENHLS